MELTEYPALYAGASAASERCQRTYFALIKAEYIFLIVAAIFSLDIIETPLYFIFYGIIFLSSFIIMIYRSHLKPEQKWYRARAVAESIKTLTWRYVTRSSPFIESLSEIESQAILRNRLKEIMQDAQFIGHDLSISGADQAQHTEQMAHIRQLQFSERFEFYKTARLNEQKSWYATKAASNRKMYLIWTAISYITYITGLILIFVRIAQPYWRFSHPEPIIIIASSIAGWIQIKKYSELSSSYSLTAHEIGLIQMGYLEVYDDKSLSDFVVEAELAFSREHTQWVARR